MGELPLDVLLFAAAVSAPLLAMIYQGWQSYPVRTWRTRVAMHRGTRALWRRVPAARPPSLVLPVWHPAQNVVEPVDVVPAGGPDAAGVRVGAWAAAADRLAVVGGGEAIRAVVRRPAWVGAVQAGAGPQGSPSRPTVPARTPHPVPAVQPPEPPVRPIGAHGIHTVRTPTDRAPAEAVAISPSAAASARGPA